MTTDDTTFDRLPGPATPLRKPSRQEEIPLRRHQARVLALQILYEVDLAAHDVAEVLPRTIETEEAPPELAAHVARLVDGVTAAQVEIDAMLAKAAPAFPVAQLPLVDRNVLRIAIYELTREAAVPPKVAINEAVEIAKRFGGPNSSKFVNGVLRTILDRVIKAKEQSAGGEGSTPR
jgi:transcription antitermination protein NusB